MHLSYLYYTLIRPFIPIFSRAILSTRDRHQRIVAHPRRTLLSAEVYIHVGTPCHRFCICHYFSEKDKLEALERKFPII
ncbi:hypothetical protein TrVE_jg11178 [Triparma verrucosa]|uniref:Uncharacterized protein n=1 Tax=Triparma verrucosa TaxID=1606542 RepID=A0A9W7B8P6_9STRA|nr:hypothetical protein TrVE_jg11178 [Triparma verrucosa]